MRNIPFENGSWGGDCGEIVGGRGAILSVEACVCVQMSVSDIFLARLMSLTTNPDVAALRRDAF